MRRDLDEDVSDPSRPRNNAAHRPHLNKLIRLGDSLSPALHDHAPPPTIDLIKLIDFERDRSRPNQL